MPAGIEARLEKLGFILPVPPPVGGNYVPLKTIGRMVYLAGVISADAQGIVAGTIGANRSIEEGYAAARSCALTHLAILKLHLGSLDRISQIVSVNGYVNAVPGFAESPRVINGASDLLVELFGDAGRHARTTIGVPALPTDAAVEVEGMFEIS
jgi:enamine deaminase RidA (YjgF/YER057c/UK114 family)